MRSLAPVLVPIALRELLLAIWSGRNIGFHVRERLLTILELASERELVLNGQSLPLVDTAVKEEKI